MCSQASRSARVSKDQEGGFRGVLRWLVLPTPPEGKRGTVRHPPGTLLLPTMCSQASRSARVFKDQEGGFRGVLR
jgi:hypothetical protein